MEFVDYYVKRLKSLNALFSKCITKRYFDKLVIDILSYNKRSKQT